MRRPRLRVLIALPVFLVVAIGLIGLSTFIERSVRDQILTHIDEELVRAEVATQSVRAELERLGGSFEPPPPLPPPPGIDSGVEFPTQLILTTEGTIAEDGGESGGAQNPFSDEQLMAISALAPGNHTIGDTPHRVLITQLEEGRVGVIALDISSDYEMLSDLRRTLIAGSIAMIIFHCAIVSLILVRVSKPLADMTAAARRVSEGNLDTVIPEPAGSRETAELAIYLERMLYLGRSTVEASASTAKDARSARKQMERFLADASHELRTPVTAVKGYAELYQENMLTSPSDLDRAMNRIASESERMARLVSDMLELARTGAFAEARMEPIDLRTLMHNVVDDLSAAHRGADIATLDTGLACVETIGDPHLIHQVLLNVAVNAIQHTPSGTPIRLSIDAVDESAEIRIIDHGPGVDHELSQRIFDPFIRADSSRARKGDSGAGLGLAIARRVVLDHGGTIEIEETPGGGSTFVVSLPLQWPQRSINEPVMVSAEQSTSV